MATIDTEKYTRINLMLVKGGTKLTRRLFLQRIKDLSPTGQEYTVDEFLNNNKTNILKKATGKNKTETIYPRSGNTNLDKWDLYLFCFVLEETCDLKVINKKDIQKLHKMRNKLCHLNEPTLTTDEFEERLEKLKIIFNRTLKLINDTDFETTLNADISNFETGPVSLACIEKFHHEVGLQRLEIIENQTKMLDNQTTMIGYHDKHSNKLDDALSRLDELSHRLPVNVDVKVPALRLIIDLQNCSGDIEESLLNFMMKLFNENITKPDCNVLEEFPNIAMYKISEAVSNTFRAFLNNDAFVVKVERKCLLLTIECKTIQSFVNFVRDYISDSLLKQLEDLQIAIRNWEGCENVVLFPQISQEEIIDAIYEMVINLDQKVPKRGQASIEYKQSTQMTSDGNVLWQSPESASSYHQRNCVRISITPRTDYGRKELDTVLKSGDIQSGVQKIQTEMREEPRFSDVKISVRLSCSDSSLTATDGSKSDDMKLICGETVSTTKLKKAYEPDGNLESGNESRYLESKLPLEKFWPGKLQDETEIDVNLSGNKIGAKRDDDHHKLTSKVKLVWFGIESDSDEEASFSERYSDTYARMAKEIIAKCNIDNESGIFSGSDQDDGLISKSDEETCHESEEEWLSSFNETVRIGDVSDLVKEARDACKRGDRVNAKRFALEAIAGANIAKEKVLTGVHSSVTDQQLADWYGGCSYVMNQIKDYSSATRCFYTAIVFDPSWTLLNHVDVSEKLWESLLYSRDINKVIRNSKNLLAFLDDMDRLARIAERRQKWGACVAIDGDINKILNFVKLFNIVTDIVKYPGRKQAMFRTARCYLNLNMHDDVRYLCSIILQHLRDYNDSEALEIWARSLFKTGDYDLAFEKNALAIKYCKLSGERDRLEEFQSQIKTKLEETVSSKGDPDERWLGANVMSAESSQSLSSSETKQRRHRRRERLKLPVTTSVLTNRPKSSLLADKLDQKRIRPPKRACGYDGRLILLSMKEKIDVQFACVKDNLIGRGGYGTVYKKWNGGFGMEIAIKKIRAQTISEKNSARKEMVASRILHPFILPLLSTFESHSRNFSEFYFISPYCENGDLYRVLEECRENPDTCRRRLNETDRMRVALQIALAIQYLHTPVPNVREIIFHKDICSSNVVLDKYKNSRLIDFGMARKKDDLSTSTSGKTHYRHRDIGKSGASASVDWDYYSLGVVYRELLTGLPPSGNGVTFLKHFRSTEISDNLDSVWITDDDESRLNADTLNTVAFSCLDANGENFCIKRNVIDAIKSVFRNSIANSSDSNACELCMINPIGSEAANQMKHTLNCRDSIRLCIACEQNTYLNPVTCYSCGAKLEPIIGHRWGALLVAGNDTNNDRNATAFKVDVESVRKLLTSRAPRVIGISTENVKMVALEKPGCEAKNEKLTPLVKQAIEEINAMDIHTLLVYFSCHGGTCSKEENFFQLASEDDKLTVKYFQEMLSSLTKIEKIILLLDCCFPDQINIPDKTIIQINACESKESAQVQENKSLFTKYIIKGLKARSEGVSCENDGENCSCCQEYYATRKDYITVGSLLEFVASHLKLKCQPEPRCNFVGKAIDIKLAYYTDEEVYLEFTDNDDKTQNTRKLPLAFCHNMDHLKSQLLSTFNKGDGSTLEVCIQNDTYRKQNRFETCDTIDKVMMAWVLRKPLIVRFLTRGPQTSSL